MTKSEKETEMRKQKHRNNRKRQKCIRGALKNIITVALDFAIKSMHRAYILDN